MRVTVTTSNPRFQKGKLYIHPIGSIVLCLDDTDTPPFSGVVIMSDTYDTGHQASWSGIYTEFKGKLEIEVE